MKKMFIFFPLILSGIFLLIFSFLILKSILNEENEFYDFRLYYLTVKAYEQDLNYYEPMTTKRIEELHLEKQDFIEAGKIKNPEITFVYPPLSIQFFKLFSIGNYKISLFIFTLIKLIALLMAFWIWYKIIKIDNLVFFTIFILFAFDSTLYHDFSYGQITIIEQLFLWSGIYAFLKRNYLLFCGLIILSSCFKLTSIFFLILLFISSDKKKNLYFAGAGVCFLLYLGLNYLIDPVMFMEFVNTFTVHFDGSRIDGRGIYHPSLYMLIDTFYYKLMTKSILMFYNSKLTIFTYGIISTIIIIISFIAVKKLYYKKNKINMEIDKTIIFLICLIYTLLNPKFMFYSYVLLFLPTYYIIQRNCTIRPFYLLFFILLLSPRHNMSGVHFINNLYWDYFPVFLTIGIWYMYIHDIIWNQKETGITTI